MTLSRLTAAAAAAAALAAVGALAACGTRLPASSFAGANGDGGVLTTQSNGVVGIGPSSSASAGSSGRTVTSGGSAAANGSGGQGANAAVGNTAGNTASDTGVTPTTLKLGLIVSKTNVLGTGAFSPSLYGAQAYVDAWNARGGQNGRRVQLLTCDDQSSASGNAQCVNSLLGQGVFAFVGNTIFDYGAAATVSKAGVPDVGGQPIDNAYDTYQHLYDIYGEAYPRNGQPGENGQLWGGDEDFLWFKQHVGVTKAGVISYNVSASQRFAKNIEQQLQAAGIPYVDESVSFGLANYSSAVLSMKQAGVDAVWDALDANGDASLCAEMDKDSLQVKAKVQNVQTWRQDVASYHAPCRDSVYVTGKTLAYSDTSNPTIAQFRQDVATFEPAQAPAMSEWMLEGWASAQWLSDALGTCATSPTRACVDTFMQRPGLYAGHGILSGRSFQQVAFSTSTTVHSCVSAARWSDSAATFIQVSNLATDCYDAPQLPYPAS